MRSQAEKLNQLALKVKIITDKRDSDLEFTATFEVLPDVKLADLKKIKVSRPVADIKAKDIKNMGLSNCGLNNLSSNPPKESSVGRSGQYQLFRGTKGGKEFDGGQGLDQDLVLGSNSMIQVLKMVLLVWQLERVKYWARNSKDYHAEELKGAKGKIQG